MEYDFGPVEQIPLGEGRNFTTDNGVIAIFRTHAGEVFATQPYCPHRQGPLADGLVGGTTVICPLHDRAYDLRTGQEIGSSCQLAIYPARTSDEQTICVRMDRD